MKAFEDVGYPRWFYPLFLALVTGLGGFFLYLKLGGHA